MDTGYTCFRAEYLQVDRPRGTTLADGPLMAHMLPICHAKSHSVQRYEKVRLAAERLVASQRASSKPRDLSPSAAEGYIGGKRSVSTYCNKNPGLHV